MPALPLKSNEQSTRGLRANNMRPSLSTSNTAPAATPTRMQAPQKSTTPLPGKRKSAVHAAPVPSKYSAQPALQRDAAMFQRRELLQAALFASSLLPAGTSLVAPPHAMAAGDGLIARLDAEDGEHVRQPSYNASSWSNKMLYYPRWLFGDWDVVSRLKAVHAPLGSKFVPPGFLQGTQGPAEDGGIGSTYHYSLRFYSTLPDTFDNNVRFLLGLGAPQDAIIADKVHNVRSMTDAFLGYPGAVESVEYDPRESPLRQSVTLSRVGPDASPLPPRHIELYINALRSEGDVEATSQGTSRPLGRVYRTSELARQVFLAVRDVQVSDYEVINEYSFIEDGRVEGRQRSLLYLNPQEPLFFKTGGQAVAVYDYDLKMQRKAPGGDAPAGAIACVETPKQVFQCI